MKRYLLILFAEVVMTVSTFAAGPTVKIPASAVPHLFSMRGVFYTGYGYMNLGSLSETIYTDADTLYFSNVFPKLLKGQMPVKAVKKADGNYHIQKQKLYDKLSISGMGTFDLYATCFKDSTDGYAYISDDDIIIYPTSNGGYTMTKNPTDVRYFALCNDNNKIITYGINFSFDPFTPDTPEVTLPENADTTNYVYSYHRNMTIYTYNYAENDAYYQNGDTVYLSHLCPEVGGWVKGHINEDGKLVVPTHQFLGAGNQRLAYMEAGGSYKYIFEWTDESKAEYSEKFDYKPVSAITFHKSGQGWIMDDSLCVIQKNLDGEIIDVNYGYKIAPFGGYTSAIPSDPESLVMEDLSKYYGIGFLSFYFNVPPTDVDGNKMIADSLEVCIYVDDEPYTFRKTMYKIDDDMTWIPYGFKDNSGGMDIRFTSLKPVVYIYASGYKSIGAQIRYTADGETNYSNIVRVYPTGIEDIPSSQVSDNPRAAYNLAGQRITSLPKGITIQNGKKYIRQ